MENPTDKGDHKGDQRLPDYLEDAGKSGSQPGAASAMPGGQSMASPLSDEQLLDGGLVPMKAWLRTKKSTGAQRTQKHREEQAAQGIKQVNVTAPEFVHDVIKKIADRTKAGVPLLEVVKEIVEELSQNQSGPAALASPQIGDAPKRFEEKLATEKKIPETFGQMSSNDDLQNCWHRRDELEQELQNLRSQLSVMQALPKLSGWRRSLICRLARIKLPF